MIPLFETNFPVRDNMHLDHFYTVASSPKDFEADRDRVRLPRRERASLFLAIHRHSSCPLSRTPILASCLLTAPSPTDFRLRRVASPQHCSSFRQDHRHDFSSGFLGPVRAERLPLSRFILKTHPWTNILTAKRRHFRYWHWLDINMKRVNYLYY